MTGSLELLVFSGETFFLFPFLLFFYSLSLWFLFCCVCSDSGK